MACVIATLVIIGLLVIGKAAGNVSKERERLSGLRREADRHRRSAPEPPHEANPLQETNARLREEVRALQAELSEQGARLGKIQGELAARIAAARKPKSAPAAVAAQSATAPAAVAAHPTVAPAAKPTPLKPPAPVLICQSCGAPVSGVHEIGRTIDGLPDADYCRHCYDDGAFIEPAITVERMVDRTANIYFVKLGLSAEEARKAALASVPKLKRWLQG